MQISVQSNNEGQSSKPMEIQNEHSSKIPKVHTQTKAIEDTLLHNMGEDKV